MDFGLKGRVAIVCGASKGLGKAISFTLAREGVNLVICARGKELLESVAKSIKEQFAVQVLPIAADLRDAENVRGIVERTLKEFSRVDILINNAGGPPSKTFEESEKPDWERALNLNFLVSVSLIQLVLPTMKSQRWGRIVNILSSGFKQPIDGLVQSNAARAALAGAAKTLSREVASYGILVNNVCPGKIQTERVDEIDTARARRSGKTLDAVQSENFKEIPMGRYGTPQEFANTVVFLASECASYITGSTLQVDGGYIRALW